MRFSLRPATAPRVRASVAVSAVCSSSMAAVTAASEGAGLEKDGFAVIRFTMPWAYVMSAGTLFGRLSATVVRWVELVVVVIWILRSRGDSVSRRSVRGPGRLLHAASTAIPGRGLCPLESLLLLPQARSFLLGRPHFLWATWVVSSVQRRSSSARRRSFAMERRDRRTRRLVSRGPPLCSSAKRLSSLAIPLCSTRTCRLSFARRLSSSRARRPSFAERLFRRQSLAPRITMPRSSRRMPRSSITMPRSSITTPRSSITMPRSSRTKPRFSIKTSRFWMARRPLLS